MGKQNDNWISKRWMWFQYINDISNLVSNWHPKISLLSQPPLIRPHFFKKYLTWKELVPKAFPFEGPDFLVLCSKKIQTPFSWKNYHVCPVKCLWWLQCWSSNARSSFKSKLLFIWEFVMFCMIQNQVEGPDNAQDWKIHTRKSSIVGAWIKPSLMLKNSTNHQSRPGILFNFIPFCFSFSKIKICFFLQTSHSSLLKSWIFQPTKKTWASFSI